MNSQKPVARYLVFVSFLGASLLSWNAYGDQSFVNPRPRSLMMGGAGVAVKGDKDSASINPAGLADITTSEWQLFPVLVEAPIDVEVIDSLLDYQESTDNGTDVEKQEKLEAFLRDAQSAQLKGRLNIYPSYTRRFMHFGLLVESVLESKNYAGGIGADLAAEAGRSQMTTGLVLAGGYGFLKNSLQVGMTVKPMYRIAAFENVDQRPLDVAKGKNRVNGESVGVTNQLFSEDWTKNRGFGVGVDLGLKYWMQSTGLVRMDRVIKMVKPSFGLSLQDIGQTRFFGAGATPQNVPQSLSAGFALHPEWKFIKGVFAFDLRNLLQEEEFTNKVHFGAEVAMWKFLLLRAGLSQLYLSGGVGLDFKYFQMDAYFASAEGSDHASVRAQQVMGLRLAAAF